MRLSSFFSFFCAVLLNQRFRAAQAGDLFLACHIGLRYCSCQVGQRTGQIDYMMNMLYSQTSSGC